MSGDVGRAIPGQPGYSGYVPGWRLPLIPVGTSVTGHVEVDNRRQLTQPSNLEGSQSKALPADAQALPKHEAFFLQKRSATDRSLYDSDVPKARAPHEVQRPYTKQHPAPPVRPLLPSPRQFNGDTVQSDATKGVLADTKRTFYSQHLQKQQIDRAAAPLEPNRKTESRVNALKGHGGASGLASLRQAPGVEAGLERPVDGPKMDFKPQPPLAERPALQKRELTSATDFMRFTTATQPTSYTQEFGARGTDPRERSEGASASINLQSGTAKTVAHHKVPGYQGHVPHWGNTMKKMQGATDVTRQHAKQNLLITTGNDLPGYSGHRPQSIFNDKDVAVQPDASLTTVGAFNKRAVEGVQEQMMNTKEHAKSHATKGFFTRGGGEDSGQVADYYFAKFRPMEGTMKHGAPGEHKWIGDQQLRRTYITMSSG